MTKWDKAYMQTAETFGSLSTAQKLKVGAIVVKEDRIISIGYNGMPSGWDNVCEYKEYDLSRDFNGNYFPDLDNHFPLTDEHGRYSLRTKKEVIHAEANAIAKLAKSTESGDGADMYITHSPCIECAKQIYTAGIKSITYKNNYRSSDGLDFLDRCGVEVRKYEHT